jgi:hypothetical protein
MIDLQWMLYAGIIQSKSDHILEKQLNPENIALSCHMKRFIEKFRYISIETTGLHPKTGSQFYEVW